MSDHGSGTDPSAQQHRRSDDDQIHLCVFTRDLRTRDLPMLHSAAQDASVVIALFVLDDALIDGAAGTVNRLRYLLDALTDLRESLRGIGGDLVVRRGDWAEQVHQVTLAGSVERIHVSDDHSPYAQARFAALQRRLDGAVPLDRHPGVTVVEPGSVRPSGGAADWKVFTPFHRRWIDTPWRPLTPAPTELRGAGVVDAGPLPRLDDLTSDELARPLTLRGGESAALARLRTWTSDTLEDYETIHDDLAADATSHIGADLHFGCLSPTEVATRLRDRPGGAAFVRQLCWRDFYHQILAARPEVAHEDYRPRGDRWRDDPEDFERWRTGTTGFPLVDAAMRQLLSEGFMHNRARMVVASFLTKDLYLDWRLGAAHFMAHLLDADVANNQLNWQWTAGTGSDTNPNRIFNPTTQSKRFDPSGAYIRRHVGELASLDAPQIHDPDHDTRVRLGYPDAMVDHREAIAAYRGALESGSTTE